MRPSLEGRTHAPIDPLSARAAPLAPRAAPKPRAAALGSPQGRGARGGTPRLPCLWLTLHVRVPTRVRPPLVQTFLLLLSLPRAKPITVGPDTKPHVNGNRILLDGGVHAWQGPSADVLSPIQDAETGKRSVIGTLAQLGEEDAIRAVESAAAAWDRGQGEWPQMPLRPTPPP